MTPQPSYNQAPASHPESAEFLGLPGQTTAQPSRTHGWFALLFIFTAVVFNFCAFFPSLQDEGLHNSDFGFHLSILIALDEVVKAGGNPLDFWYDSSPFGFALFRSYQNLPYLVTYALHAASFSLLTLDGSLRVTTLLLACFFPLSVYWSLRKLSFTVYDAGFAALCGVLISEAQNFGLGFQNYTFGTAGIITQLWAVVALPPALVCSIRYIQHNRALMWALLWSFFCFGCHVVSAVILLIAVGSYAAIAIWHAPKATTFRALTYFVSLAALTTYQWLYTILDSRYINKSSIEQSYKYGSHGLRWVVEKFFTSGLFDNDRSPSLTFFLVFGLICGAADIFVLRRNGMRTLSRTLLWILGSFILALSLLVGWEIWGPIFKHTPLLRSLHMHRFIIAVNLFGLILIAYGCGVLRSLLPQRAAVLTLFTIGVFTALSPAFEERLARHAQAEQWRSKASTAWNNAADLREVIHSIRSHPRTYVHPGHFQTWTPRLKLAGLVPLHELLIGQGIPTVGGLLFHAFSLAGDTMFALSTDRKATLDLFGVGFVIAPPSRSLPSYLSPVTKNASYTLYSYPNATRISPIALTFNVRGDREDESRFMQRWVASPLAETLQCGAIDGEIANLPSLQFKDPAPTHLPSTHTATRQIREKSWRSGAMEAEVVMASDGYLMFKTGYHPSWEATVDGAVVKTIWVTPGFIGIPIQKGSHSVEFTYRGSQTKLWLFLGALGVFTAMLAFGHKKHRTTTPLEQ